MVRSLKKTRNHCLHIADVLNNKRARSFGSVHACCAWPSICEWWTEISFFYKRQWIESRRAEHTCICQRNRSYERAQVAGWWGRKALNAPSRSIEHRADDEKNSSASPRAKTYKCTGILFVRRRHLKPQVGWGVCNCRQKGWKGGGGGRIRTELADWQPKEGGGGCVGWVSIPIHKAICVLWLLGAWRQVRLLLSWVQRLWEPRGHSQATSMSSKRRHKAFRVHWSRWLRPRLGKQNANRELLSVKSSSVTKKVGAVENKRERSRQETSVTLRQREREAAHGCTDEPNTRKRCHAENKQIPNHL